MFVATVVKRTLMLPRHVSCSVNVPHFARVRLSSVCSRWQTSAVFRKSRSFNVRQFSCTRVTNFRTANSFICQRDKDDSETEVPDNPDLSDDFLQDPRYTEVFKETYLRPVDGHQVFAIQPAFKELSKRPRNTTSELQLDELCTLVETLNNWTVIDRAVHPVRHVDKSDFFGKGKLEELTQYIRRKRDISAVVLGVNMLSALQLATLQDLWKVAVYDRYTVVLQIFNLRAKSKEARLQVALAELPYLRSRLRGMHYGTLEHQRGSMRHIGGSGETYMEMRRQLLKERELKLRRELDKLKAQRDLLRQHRRKRQFPVIAVVGYTNAGKTSLIKALTGEQSMQPRDQLFATLDVTMHAGRLPNSVVVLYADTIGFISDIPTDLIESFAAVLEDINNADVLVHIRDISHPDAVAQKVNVLETLQRQNVESKRLDNMIEVCNKVDRLDKSELKSALSDGAIPVSVKNGWGLAQLQQHIVEAVSKSTGRITKRLLVPINGPHLAWLYKQASIESTQPDDRDTQKIFVNAIMTEAVYAKFVATFARKRNS